MRPYTNIIILCIIWCLVLITDVRRAGPQALHKGGERTRTGYVTKVHDVNIISEPTHTHTQLRKASRNL